MPTTIPLHRIHDLARPAKRSRLNWWVVGTAIFALSIFGLAALFIRAAWIAARAQYL